MRDRPRDRPASADKAIFRFTARASPDFRVTEVDIRPNQRILLATAAALVLAAAPASGQQVADTTFTPEVTAPAFPRGEGPVVLVDEAHHNFHTAGGRYAPFAWILRHDGYRVRSLAETLRPASLAGADVLVIANALNERNVEDWSVPTPPAFTDDEIEAVRAWVEAGGSLLLIADHMPFPGAAGTLAAAFGFEFHNGFVRDTLDDCVQCAMVFRGAQTPAGSPGGLLREHPITRGVGGIGRIDSVATFTGQGFVVPPEGETLLELGPGAVQMLPDVAWQFDEFTPSESAVGLAQGAVRLYGRGRVAVFGEAAMFTAQLAGPDGDVRMGMNAPEAPDNAQFLLNTLHWLSQGP